jgi:hypothetical protein
VAIRLRIHSVFRLNLGPEDEKSADYPNREWMRIDANERRRIQPQMNADRGSGRARLPTQLNVSRALGVLLLRSWSRRYTQAPGLATVSALQPLDSRSTFTLKQSSTIREPRLATETLSAYICVHLRLDSPSFIRVNSRPFAVSVCVHSRFRVRAHSRSLFGNGMALGRR